MDNFVDSVPSHPKNPHEAVVLFKLPVCKALHKIHINQRLTIASGFIAQQRRKNVQTGPAAAVWWITPSFIAQQAAFEGFCDSVVIFDSAQVVLGLGCSASARFAFLTHFLGVAVHRVHHHRHGFGRRELADAVAEVENVGGTARVAVVGQTKGF